MLRLIWRLQRRGLIGMSAFGVFYGLIQAAAYNAIAGTSAESRLAFGEQMQTIGQQFSIFLPLPHAVGTIGGFIQWRVYGALPMLFGFWALMSAAGASRGDEERGLVEEWLAAGVSRTRYLVSRLLLFGVAAVIAIALTSVAIDLGALGAGSTLPIVGVIEAGLALLGLTLTVYTLSLAVAQFVVSRTSAAGLAGLIVGILFFVNSLSRSVESLRSVAGSISPFFYYDRTQPLSPGGSFDLLGTVGLFLASVAFTALAAWLLTVRDLGSSLIRFRPRPRPSTVRPSGNPLLRLPILALWYEQRVGMAAWAIACGVLAAYLASIGRQMLDLMRGANGFRVYLTLIGHGDPYAALTGYLWFGIFLTLLAIFSITQVARWSADDNEGRLEMVLSAPVARSRVVVERAAALLLRIAVVVAVSAAGLELGAAGAGISIGAGSLTVASLLLIPFGLSFAAIGAVMASWVPRLTVGVLTAFTFVSYLLTELGPLLRWPDWALKLSVFTLYGTPLTSGIDWTGLLIMTAITLIGFGLASVLIQRRDVGA